MASDATTGAADGASASRLMAHRAVGLDERKGATRVKRFDRCVLRAGLGASVGLQWQAVYADRTHFRRLAGCVRQNASPINLDTRESAPPTEHPTSAPTQTPCNRLRDRGQR